MTKENTLEGRLGRTDLRVFPVCLGTNVFGWTADEAESFAVLDAFVAQGGNLLDSADSYSAFAPGNRGGESETIIGRWLSARGRRDDVLIATKVGRHPKLPGLSADNIAAAVEASLQRLQTDYIDLYWAHADDPETPLEETLSAFDELIRAGKVRYIGASNYSTERLREALRVSSAGGMARFEALQPHYNLLERDHYEGALADLCVAEDISCLPYFSLAKGFLTGKHRRGADASASPRASQALGYLDARGERLLKGLDQVAAAHATSVTAVALAWLRRRPAVLAPIASARITAQLADIMAAATVELSDEEVQQLTDLAPVRER
jgi:aryl-alcohol dehydrogenase (NADP+)